MLSVRIENLRLVIYSLFLLLTCSNLLALPWYDEAAVLENLSSSSWQPYPSSFNWLQVIPPGYFLIGKLIVNFGIPWVCLRLISALAVIFGLEIILRRLSRFPNSIYSIVFIAITLFNPLTIQYAQSVKHYTISLPLAATSFILQRHAFRKRLFLAVLSFLFSPICLLLIALVALVNLKRDRQIIVCNFLVIGFSLSLLYISSILVGFETQLQMRQEWQLNNISFRDAIGNAAHFVSWFGLLPNLYSFSLYKFIALLSLVLILVFVGSQISKKVTLQISLYLISLALMHFMALAPLTGRLHYGFGILLIFFFFESLSRLSSTRVMLRDYAASLLFLSITFHNVLTAPIDYWGGFKNNLSVPLSGQSKSYLAHWDIWAGPYIKFYSETSSSIVDVSRSPLVYDSVSNKINIFCLQEIVQAGDSITLFGLSETERDELKGTLNVLDVSSKSFLHAITFKVTENMNHLLDSTPIPTSPWYCSKFFANPGTPPRER